MNDPHASPEELLAFLCDGDPLPQTVQQHLDRCQRCQQQIVSYQKTATCLFTQMYRRDCPSGAALSAWCLPNVLSDGEQSQISKHLTQCPLCAAELAETLQFLETS